MCMCSGGCLAVVLCTCFSTAKASSFAQCLSAQSEPVSDPTPGVWGRPRGTSAGLYGGLPYKPGHAYETNPRHRRGNRGSKRRVREAEEDTREAEEDKE